MIVTLKKKRFSYNLCGAFSRPLRRVPFTCSFSKLFSKKYNLILLSSWQNEFVVLCKIFEKKSRGPKTDEEYESPVEEDADDCVNGDDENGSLVSFLFAIQSSSMGPEEGQNTVATISALNIENGQDTVLQPLPPHTATTIVPQHHPSPPENDVHKLLLNVSDEDGDTCDGGGSSQVRSI